MQVQPVPQQPGKPALSSGIIVGITLGIIHSVITIILQLSNNQQAPDAPASMTSIILPLIIPLIWLTGFLIAGIWGGKTTGKVSTGTLVGLFAGTFGGLLASVGQIIAIAISTTGPYANNNSYPGSSTALIFLGFLTILYVLILTIGGGAGIGALGGLLGQSISNVRPQPAAPTFPVATVLPYPPAQPYPPMTPIYGYMPPQPQVPPDAPMPRPQPPSENVQ